MKSFYLLVTFLMLNIAFSSSVIYEDSPVLLEMKLKKVSYQSSAEGGKYTIESAKNDDDSTTNDIGVSPAVNATEAKIEAVNATEVKTEAANKPANNSTETAATANEQKQIKAEEPKDKDEVKADTKVAKTEVNKEQVKVDEAKPTTVTDAPKQENNQQQPIKVDSHLSAINNSQATLDVSLNTSVENNNGSKVNSNIASTLEPKQRVQKDDIVIIEPYVVYEFVYEDELISCSDSLCCDLITSSCAYINDDDVVLVSYVLRGLPKYVENLKVNDLGKVTKEEFATLVGSEKKAEKLSKILKSSKKSENKEVSNLVETLKQASKEKNKKTNSKESLSCGNVFKKIINFDFNDLNFFKYDLNSVIYYSCEDYLTYTINDSGDFIEVTNDFDYVYLTYYFTFDYADDCYVSYYKTKDGQNNDVNKYFKNEEQAKKFADVLKTAKKIEKNSSISKKIAKIENIIKSKFKQESQEGQSTKKANLRKQLSPDSADLSRNMGASRLPVQPYYKLSSPENHKTSDEQQNFLKNSQNKQKLNNQADLLTAVNSLIKSYNKENNSNVELVKEIKEKKKTINDDEDTSIEGTSKPEARKTEKNEKVSTVPSSTASPVPTKPVNNENQSNAKAAAEPTIVTASNTDEKLQEDKIEKVQYVSKKKQTDDSNSNNQSSLDSISQDSYASNIEPTSSSAPSDADKLGKEILANFEKPKMIERIWSEKSTSVSTPTYQKNLYSNDPFGQMNAPVRFVPYPKEIETFSFPTKASFTVSQNEPAVNKVIGGINNGFQTFNNVLPTVTRYG